MEISARLLRRTDSKIQPEPGLIVNCLSAGILAGSQFQQAASARVRVRYPGRTMTSIEKQVEVLNRLTQIMHDSANGMYDEMRCEFEYEPYEGGWSVGSKFSFVRQGGTVSKLLDDSADDVPALVHQLHELMKAHTGGNWKSFVLTVDTTGRANTKFAYEA